MKKTALAKPATESAEQKIVVAWLRARGYTPIGSQNGASMPRGRWAQAAILGACAGAPDFYIVEMGVAEGYVTPVAVEMKNVEGGRVSAAQKSMHVRLRDAGWHVIVGRGADDAISQLRALGY